jgi:hypothetical protein
VNSSDDEFIQPSDKDKQATSSWKKNKHSSR